MLYMGKNPVEINPTLTTVEVSGYDIGLGITGANSGDLIKILSVDVNGTPTAWEPYSEKGYELIERIYIGFSLTTSQPSDWATNWTNYYINNGTTKLPVYEHVTGESAPTWEAGIYYKFTETVPGSGANSYFTISRNIEPNGTSYNFKKMALKVSVASPAAGQFRIYCYDNNNNTMAAGFGTGPGYSEIITDGAIGKCYVRNQYIGNSPNDQRYGTVYFTATGNIAKLNIYTTIASMVRTEADYYEFYGWR